MSAADEAHAASVLAGLLLGQGWTVRLEDETRVDAERRGERLNLEPILDPAGLDRILVTRRWARAPGASGEALRDFALELNETLNVGQFHAFGEDLAFQSSLPFIDSLDPRLLSAYLAFTADVRLAVLQVQGERELLVPVEGEQGSR